MSEITKQFTNHVMFNPMNEFLSLAKKNSDTLLDSIKSQDESVIDMLKTLHDFGFYHILIPLYEFVPYIISEDTLFWWKGKISTLNNYDQCVNILKTFHENTTNYVPKQSFKDLPYIWSFHTSVANMETLLWNSYPDNMVPLLNQDIKSNLGILIPGLYLNPLNENYIKLLETYTFPCLLKITQQFFDYQTVSDCYETAVIKYAIKLYSRELGLRYFNTFSFSLNRVLAYSEKDLANMHYNEFKRILLCEGEETSITTYLSLQWVTQIHKLTYYAKKFLFTSNVLNYSLPILLQCVGLNDDANTYLLDTLEHMNGRERSNEVFLLGLYRALVIERYSNHQKIFIKMNEIFNSEKISNNLIDVFEDILKFYKILSDELPKRFKKETLEELIIHANKDDKVFYENYMFYCNYGDDILEDVKLTYDYLFSNDKLISLFENQLNIVKDPCLAYSKRVLHVHLLAKLFYSLTSHLNQEIRINLGGCLTYLGINDVQPTMKYKEVFYVYSHSQHINLIELTKRLQTEMEHVPAYTTVYQFEQLKFENTDSDKQLYAIIEKLYMEIEQIKMVQKCSDTIQNNILKYVSSKDDTLNQTIMDALINNKELTLEFCNCIYEICKSPEAKQLPTEKVEQLNKIGELLESAISHPEEYQKKIIKSEFLSAINNFAACFPVISNITNLSQGIYSLKKVFDTLNN